jgi:hypothetical protein
MFRVDGVVPPQMLSRSKGSLASFFTFRYPDSEIVFEGAYLIRDKKFLYESKACDDKLSFVIPINSVQKEYRIVLLRHFPELLSAIGGYRAAAYLGSYANQYDQIHRPVLTKLRDVDGKDIDGRNNIFTLNVVQYWDGQLCQRALGYGRDEVTKRLTGKVPLVQPLMDGVYVVFNDNPDLTFEEFCAYNDRLKPVLGLQ